jgi:molybdate transport system substrate-binding protein
MFSSMSCKSLGVLALFPVILYLLLSGCNAKDARPRNLLVVFAASSLTDAFRELKPIFERVNPGVEVIFNFAGSSTLRAQLAEGAQADIFASADLSQMNMAKDAGVIDGISHIFAYNRLTLAASSFGHVHSLQDLASPGTKIVLALEEVPAGAYANELLDLMSQDIAYGMKYTDEVINNIVSREANVRLALAKVILGEADASIVYQSDIKAADAEVLRIIIIPEQLGPKAQYYVALVRESGKLTQAKSFVNFLLSPASQKVLEKSGFQSLVAT